MKRSDTSFSRREVRVEIDWDKTIRELFEQVWCSALGSAIRKRTLSSIDCPAEAERSASIGILGAWNGEVVLTCPESTAREFAAALHRCPEDSLSDEDVRATLRELVNILGGNVKSTLPGQHQLSMPRDGDSSLSDADFRHFQPVCSLGLDFCGWPVRLSIAERR